MMPSASAIIKVAPRSEKSGPFCAMDISSPLQKA